MFSSRNFGRYCSSIVWCRSLGLMLIVKALKGDLGAVELRTVRTRIPGKVITGLGEQQGDDPEEVKMNAPARADEEADDGLTKDEEEKLKALLDDGDKSSSEQDDDHEVVKMNAPARAKEEVDEDYGWGQLLDDGLTEDKQKLGALFGDVEKSSSERKYWKLSDVIQYSDDAFMLFMENLRSYSDWQEMAFELNPEDEFVNVAGDYKIPRCLVPIYEDLVDKHGDVSEDCEFSLSGKSLLYVYLLSVIYSMRNKQVSIVTEDDLRRCHGFLKWPRLAGFRIQFAIENLMNKLAPAYFGLQLVKFGPDRLHDLDRQIKQHSEAIEEQEAKLQVVPL